MKNRIFSGLLVAVFGSLIALGPQFLFKVCEAEGDMIMRCFWTGRAEIGIGGVIFLSGLFLAFFKNPALRFGVNLGLIPLGILTLLIPTVLIGVCGSHSMECRILALPSLVVLGILLIAAALLNGLYLYARYLKNTPNEA